MTESPAKPSQSPLSIVTRPGHSPSCWRDILFIEHYCTKRSSSMWKTNKVLPLPGGPRAHTHPRYSIPGIKRWTFPSTPAAWSQLGGRGEKARAAHPNFPKHPEFILVAGLVIYKYKRGSMMHKESLPAARDDLNRSRTIY